MTKRLFVLIILLFTGQIFAQGSQEEKEMNTKRKVLIVVTNHSQYPTRTDSTGLWLTELTHFYDIIKEAGYEIDLASPQGGKTPLDERSLGWMYMDKSAKEHLKNSSFTDKLNSTQAISSVNPDDYLAIYFAGGHGTMWDFKDNDSLKKVAEKIYNNNGYVTSVCHGAAALLNLRLPDGRALIAGKKVTGFSNTEESLAGLKNEVPFFLESELKKLGANYHKSLLPFIPYAITDGHLITGQNPNSAKEVANALLTALKKN